MEALQPLSNDSFSYSWLVNVKPSSLEALDGAVRLSFDAADGDPFIEIDPWLASLRRLTVDVAGGAAHEFDFGLSGSQSPVLAEEIFSNGLILPLPLAHPPIRRRRRRQEEDEEEEPRCSDADELSRSLLLDSSRLLLSLSNRHKSPHMYAGPGRPTSSLQNSSSSPPLRFRSALPLNPSAKQALSRRPGRPRLPFLRTCGRTSKRLLQKYLCFLMPLYRKVKGLNMVVWRAEGSSVIVPSVPRSCAASLDGSSPRMSVDALRPAVSCRRGLTTAAPDTGMEKSIHDAVLHCKKSIGDQSGQLVVGITSDEQRKICDVSK